MPAADKKDRKLPKKRNPHLAADKTPEHQELASRRRLGSTTLKVKPGQVGTSNATQKENLGLFEYAHLRVPLPDNLKGSEIFEAGPDARLPEAYFLMRRSSDGFISATGMFKAAFPWAKTTEEHDEREHVKSLPSTGHDEVAGNVWIPETSALSLAEDYGMLPWVVALLDPAPVPPVASAGEEKHVTAPPKFVFKGADKLAIPPGTNLTPARRRRATKGSAASPTKTPGSAKATSPKKRSTKALKEANAAAARQATETLNAVLDGTPPASESAVTASDEGGDKKPQIKSVTSSARKVNASSVKHETTVKVEMPSPGALPTPQSTAEMIESAKRMVAEARKEEAANGKPPGSPTATTVVVKKAKRKASDAGERAGKKAKTETVQQERVRNRAMLGVAATLAIGAVVPYILG